MIISLLSTAHFTMTVDFSETPVAPPSHPIVLIVDDDKALADTYATWLSDQYDVETAYGGVQAEKRLHQGIDVVLLDRRMPGKPGDEVLGEIRAQGIDCQVAMLTAVEPDTDIIDLPFDEYLVKPVTQSELTDAVDNLLLRSGFTEEAQEFLAMESKSHALRDRDPESLRDPEAAAELHSTTERVGRSEWIQKLKTRLNRLERITSLIRDIGKQLVAASTREEIEQTTCKRLANADQYELAWIGEYTVGFDQISPRSVAGNDNVSLKENSISDISTNDDSITEAVETETAQVVDNLSLEETPRLLEPLKLNGGPTEFSAAVVVPLVYRDTVYGTLNIFTAEQDVFDSREVAVLSELGDRIANAINSVERKNLMFSDTVLELEFDVHDQTDVFVSLSAQTDSRIELKGFVPSSDRQLTSYAEVTRAPTDTFMGTATEKEHIDQVRRIGQSDTAPLYECRVSDSSIVLSVIEAGATVKTMHVDSGKGFLKVHVGPDTDVRTVVESIQQTYDDITLTAKRETHRDFQSTEDFRRSLENRLTDRQYSILKATYSAGYFEWPRKSSAKEIANSIDIAPPTLHEHLRLSQKELIETFFEETGETEVLQYSSSE